MNERRQRGAMAWGIALALGLVVASGCGNRIGKYKLTGTVTYGDKPIVLGSMILEPAEGLANSETVANADIRDGRYETEVVGGKHRVLIRDLSSESGQPGSRSLFVYEYATEIDLPKESSEAVVHDISIPLTHR
jgi:hypothetical protein